MNKGELATFECKGNYVHYEENVDLESVYVFDIEFLDVLRSDDEDISPDHDGSISKFVYEPGIPMSFATYGETLKGKYLFYICNYF